jgi:CubicO group peptidase (beta-lactamase class C family)
MRIRFGACSAAVLLAAATLTAQQTSVVAPFGALPVLESYLEALRQQAGIPGMSAAVVRDGSIIWERGFGYQNVAAKQRASADTPYVIGDLSQTFASVLLLQCVEYRMLDLDDPFRNRGIDIPERDQTLRLLMSHTYPDDAQDPFLYNPERYSHLTAAVEHCAPQPYRKTVSHRLINRLAMVDTVPGTDLRDANLQLPEGLYEPSELERYRRVLERLAIPYKVDTKGRAERNDQAPVTISASGGIVSTVRDLARLDAAIDSDLLLLNETKELSWTTTPVRHGTVLAPTGLGWFVQTYKNERVVWHFGYVAGAYSSLWLKIPGRNVSLILLANSDGLSAPFQLAAGDVTRSIFATLFLKLAI